MADSKQYRLTNKEPGPRGLQTAADGLVMVQPTPEGVTSGVIATLTEDEAAIAKRQGLSIEAVEDDELVPTTENIPAAGHIDPNAPDAAEKLGIKSSSKRAAKADAEGADTGKK